MLGNKCVAVQDGSEKMCKPAGHSHEQSETFIQGTLGIGYRWLFAPVQLIAIGPPEIVRSENNLIEQYPRLFTTYSSESTPIWLCNKCFCQFAFLELTGGIRLLEWPILPLKWPFVSANQNCSFNCKWLSTMKAVIECLSVLTSQRFQLQMTLPCGRLHFRGTVEGRAIFRISPRNWTQPWDHILGKLHI